MSQSLARSSCLEPGEAWVDVVHMDPQISLVTRDRREQDKRDQTCKTPLPIFFTAGNQDRLLLHIPSQTITTQKGGFLHF